MSTKVVAQFHGGPRNGRVMPLPHLYDPITVFDDPSTPRVGARYRLRLDPNWPNHDLPSLDDWGRYQYDYVTDDAI